jgi:hypothetical protein
MWFRDRHVLDDLDPRDRAVRNWQESVGGGMAPSCKDIHGDGGGAVG